MKLKNKINQEIDKKKQKQIVIKGMKTKHDR